MPGYGERRLQDTRKGESSTLLCDTSLATKLAPLVRGSSRRFTTMPAAPWGRSANSKGHSCPVKEPSFSVLDLRSA